MNAPEPPAVSDELVELAARGSAEHAGDDCFAEANASKWWAEPQRRMYRDRARTVLEFAAPVLRGEAYAVGYAEAVARLRDDGRYRDWWTATPERSFGTAYWAPEGRQHLADYLETVGVDQLGPLFRLLELPDGVLPAGVAAIVGDFTELERARSEGRDVNWRAFAVLRDQSESEGS